MSGSKIEFLSHNIVHSNFVVLLCFLRWWKMASTVSEQSQPAQGAQVTCGTKCHSILSP